MRPEDKMKVMKNTIDSDYMGFEQKDDGGMKGAIHLLPEMYIERNGFGGTLQIVDFSEFFGSRNENTVS